MGRLTGAQAPWRGHQLLGRLGGEVWHNEYVYIDYLVLFLRCALCSDGFLGGDRFPHPPQTELVGSNFNLLRTHANHALEFSTFFLQQVAFFPTLVIFFPDHF